MISKVQSAASKEYHDVKKKGRINVMLCDEGLSI